jgi:hypothetical protein
LAEITNRHDPAQYYSGRLSHFEAKIGITRRRLKWMAFLRLMIFLATVVLVAVATRWNLTIISIIIITGLAAFLFTVIRYIVLQRKLRKDETMVSINQNELKSLAGDFSMFNDGSEFNDPEHPFTADLDIFGPQSLFQLINRSSTHPGKSLLAQWFAFPNPDTATIRMRQDAVGELAQKPGFRQEFQATGYLASEMPSDKDELLAWVNEPAVFNHRKFIYYLAGIDLLTCFVVFLIIAGVISPTWLILYVAVPFGFIGFYLKTINKKYQVLSGKAGLMKKFSSLFTLIESENFTSDQMKRLKSSLNGKNRLPGAATRDLSAILDAFDARNNMLLAFLLNFFFLWDIIQVIRTERWQARYRDELPRWIDVLAETDAICSLANFHFNHPGSVFPKINEDGTLLRAEALGHPLIPEAERVSNPAAITGQRHFTIITGANMAGKSTYLRTVGVNLVLAMAGCAVIAESMSFCPVGLVTSIRTNDSLQKNESYFYAELKRLKYIIERLQQGEKLVILLDEILKGTNSRDKQGGSVALMTKLMHYDASGFIATHDLSLGELETAYPANFTNKSFEVVIENDELVFDYKLKDGIARQMNATFLMKKMGITD